jgi:hypothetical protein
MMQGGHRYVNLLAIRFRDIVATDVAAASDFGTTIWLPELVAFSFPIVNGIVRGHRNPGKLLFSEKNLHYQDVSRPRHNPVEV